MQIEVLFIQKKFGWIRLTLYSHQSDIYSPKGKGNVDVVYKDAVSGT